MSIIAVHGPYTFGSKAVTEVGPVQAVVSGTNGLLWTFKLDVVSPRPDQDFSWAFPTDGTPTPQTVENPTPVTYATPGSKTATLTVTNVSRTVSNKALTNNVATLTTTATHGFVVGQSVTITGVDATFNGTYTITGTPTGTTFTYALVAANVTSAASGGTVTSDANQYPPAGSYPITVTAVSGAAPQLLRAAPGGDEAQYPDGGGYDPGDYTVPEVEQYVEDHPDQLEAIIEAEQAGKARVTLLTYLESMRP